MRDGGFAGGGIASTEQEATGMGMSRHRRDVEVKMTTTAARKKAAKKAHSNSRGHRKWSAGVTTESTYPGEGLFKKDAESIARELASKKVSPKGPSSGMRMLTFYINRAGKNLPEARRKELERAKGLLHKKVEAAKRRDRD